MGRIFGALRAKAHPVSMLIVGMLLMPLGVYLYPAFIIVGLLYLFIGLRGFRMPARHGAKSARSDKSQFESL